MDAETLRREARTLLELVANRRCSLAADTLAIDPNSYLDPVRYQVETERLFRRYPQFVGPSCLLPAAGDCFAFDDTGVPLLVVRGEDGALTAFINSCSHRGAPLAQGLGCARDGKRLSCPYHGWTYDIGGALIGIPWGEAGFPNLDRGTHGLQPIPVAEQDGCIFVLPDPAGQLDAAATLAGLGVQLCGFGLGDHRLLGRKRTETALNWKLNMDTFHEFYHFAALHPESIAAMSYSNIGHYRQFGRNHSLSSPTLQITDLLQQPESDWRPRDYLSLVIFLFPNSVLFIVGDHFHSWQVYPLGVDRSVVYHSMYVPPQDSIPRAERESWFQLIHDVAVNEDYALVEQIQRGLAARRHRHLVVGRNEPGVQNMHRHIAEILGSEGS